uniref:Uncharacterized protein n=1 Tax=Panagrolaimus sp. ES5 TaxID=591445 RepID=A0AC34F7P2_9BILA
MLLLWKMISLIRMFFFGLGVNQPGIAMANVDATGAAEPNILSWAFLQMMEFIQMNFLEFFSINLNNEWDPYYIKSLKHNYTRDRFLREKRINA